MYFLLCASVFLATYLVNMTIITVFYHRGLAHQAVQLSPGTRRFAARFGIWLTGLDAKGWVCMHRKHHRHSDSPEDPHSPVHYGLFGVLLAQLKSYERTLVGLHREQPEYCDEVADLEFGVSPLNRKKLWFLPYVLHLLIAIAIAAPTGLWALGACYFLGMMSHPIEGWIVNSLGHAVGGRNFETPDNSRNNQLAGWIILGEGYQNNHHQYPASAKFSYQPWEMDLGYGITLALEKFGMLEIRRECLIPSPAAQAELAD